tara:strand:- start:3723 stop:5171 length:1449 start_codon:yes stop_codon:yes gene_type:complete
MSDDLQTSMVERGSVAPSVPDLLRVSPMNTTTATDVETSISDPVVITNSFCRFVLLNKGILHSHSKVTLGVVAQTNGSTTFFPPTCGVASLIQRAALKVGTKTLQEIDGYNFMTTYKNMFISNEHQKEREQVQSAKCISHEFRYLDGTTTTGVDNNTKANTYGLSNGIEYDNDDLKVHRWQDLANAPLFQIALADLFPMLKQTQLPLYMMEEQVSIELTFTSVDEQRAQNASDASTAGTYTIDTNNVQFVADYIYYPQEMMAAYRAANPVITINHFDYRHSKVSVSATSANGATLIRNLGGAGRIVTKVITGLQSEDTGQDDGITNVYHSISPAPNYVFGDAPTAAEYNGSLTVNLKYNDRFLYPIDVTNPARQFHNTAQAEGMVPFITREEFSAEGVALTADKFQGYVQNLGAVATDMGILGRFNWLSYRLNRNERVNSRGVEYYYKYDGLNNAASFTQRSWLELAKVTVLQNGFVSTELL